MNHTIKTMHVTERPYEKCGRFGAESLTDAELLAILLRTGTKGENSLELAKRILYPGYHPEGLLRIPACTKEELLKIKGIGDVKAIQILCLAELAKRLSQEASAPSVDFQKPQTVAEYYMEEMRHLKQEVLKLLMLNTKAGLISETILTKGTVNSSVISPRELFMEALQKNAVSIILLHNHPSGDPSPSKEDILVTKRIKACGDMLNVHLLDHIIIGNRRYVSFAEKGLL